MGKLKRCTLLIGEHTLSPELHMGGALGYVHRKHINIYEINYGLVQICTIQCLTKSVGGMIMNL